MSKVKIVGNSYQNVSITVDGVEIPCMKADIHISNNAGIVATLTVPAELDISTLNVVLNTAPTLPMTGRGCDLRKVEESARERWLNHLLRNEMLAIDEKGRLTDHQATVIEMRFNVKLAMTARKDGVEDFAFVLLQHDGFSLSIRKNTATWIKRFQGAVNEEAAKLGILTELELSYDPARDEAPLMAALKPRPVWLDPQKRKRGGRVGVADFSEIPNDTSMVGPAPAEAPAAQAPSPAAPAPPAPAPRADFEGITARAEAHRVAWAARQEEIEAADRARRAAARERREARWAKTRRPAPVVDPNYRWGVWEEQVA